MARATDQCSLGCRGPFFVSWNRRSKGSRICTGRQHTQAPHRALHQPTTRKARSPKARKDRQEHRQAMTLARRLAAEALGTAFLLAVVVGSGIMGERLAEGHAAVALLANSIATGCGLWVLITIFGPISGAHFNPAVTLAFAIAGEFKWSEVLPYIATQIIAAFVGVAAAHLMFELP